jgi:anti-sigma regulatory factor (Ser/Thr protein kinase)
VRTVGFSTDGHGRAAPTACFRLDPGRRAERASPCARPRSWVISRAAGRAGKAGALVARAVVRESVTVAGRAERARVARAFTAGVLGPGHPCRDDAALLVSELFGNSIRHSGSGAAGQTVTVRAAGGVVRVEVTDRGGSGAPQLRPFDGEAEDGRGWAWWRDWPPGGAGGGAAGGRWPSSSCGTAEPPRPAAGPGTGGQAGRAGVHGKYTPVYMPGLRQAHRRRP